MNTSIATIETSIAAMTPHPTAGARVGGLAAGTAAPSSAKALSIFSRRELLDEFEGDEVFMNRMIALFRETTPGLLNDIRSSVARRGSSDLARSAHALLSSLGAFGANDARQLTLELEAQAQHENYEHTDRTFAALERETFELHAALATFASAGP